MTTEREQYEAALEIASKAREAYLEGGSSPSFREWRDASDIAIKWHRAMRLASPDDDTEDEPDPMAEFDAIAAGKAAR